jgi:uncharacterized membrane protein
MFSWIFGLVFWLLYMAIGVVVYIYYCRLFSKKHYDVLIGKAKKDEDGDWKTEDGTYVFPNAFYSTLFLVWFFWPIVVCVGVVFFFVIIFGKVVCKGFFHLARTMASRLPEISVKKKCAVDEVE